MYVNNIFSQLEKNLPPLFCRKEATRLLGGLFSANSLRNLDSQKKGPGNKIKIGKKVMYEKDSFLNWLRNYK
jgi:hypothetical protein